MSACFTELESIVDEGMVVFGFLRVVLCEYSLGLRTVGFCRGEYGFGRCNGNVIEDEKIVELKSRASNQILSG